MTTQAQLDRLVEALDPTKRACFFPTMLLVEGKSMAVTRCSDFTGVFVAALGAPFAPPGSIANVQHAWLSEPANGWRQVDERAAYAAVGTATAIVASWANPDIEKHGHICPVVGVTAEQLLISAAGAENLTRCTLSRTFGYLKPDFFVYP